MNKMLGIMAWIFILAGAVVNCTVFVLLGLERVVDWRLHLIPASAALLIAAFAVERYFLKWLRKPEPPK